MGLRPPGPAAKGSGGGRPQDGQRVATVAGIQEGHGRPTRDHGALARLADEPQRSRPQPATCGVRNARAASVPSPGPRGCSTLIACPVSLSGPEGLGHDLVYLNLYFQGEPYLHPGMDDLVRVGKRAGLYVSTSTNAHHIDGDRAESLVRSGIDRLIISIDKVTRTPTPAIGSGANSTRCSPGRGPSSRRSGAPG